MRETIKVLASNFYNFIDNSYFILPEPTDKLFTPREF